MLAIRMQRTGRSGHAQFRVVVQDSRFSPTSGRVVEYIGSYNPHTKTTVLDKDKAASYLSNGAQPSESAAKLLQAEGVKLPKWVAKPTKKQGAIRNLEKLRRNRPAEPATEAPAQVTDETPVAEATEEAETASEANDQPPAAADETPAEEPAKAPAETPAEETPDETPTE